MRKEETHKLREGRRICSLISLIEFIKGEGMPVPLPISTLRKQTRPFHQFHQPRNFFTFREDRLKVTRDKIIELGLRIRGKRQRIVARERNELGDVSSKRIREENKLIRLIFLSQLILLRADLRDSSTSNAM